MSRIRNFLLWATGPNKAPRAITDRTVAQTSGQQSQALILENGGTVRIQNVSLTFPGERKLHDALHRIHEIPRDFESRSDNSNFLIKEVLDPLHDLMGAVHSVYEETFSVLSDYCRDGELSHDQILSFLARRDSESRKVRDDLRAFYKISSNNIDIDHRIASYFNKCGDYFLNVSDYPLDSALRGIVCQLQSKESAEYYSYSKTEFFQWLSGSVDRILNGIRIAWPSVAREYYSARFTLLGKSIEQLHAAKHVAETARYCKHDAYEEKVRQLIDVFKERFAGDPELLEALHEVGNDAVNRRKAVENARKNGNRGDYFSQSR